MFSILIKGRCNACNVSQNGPLSPHIGWHDCTCTDDTPSMLRPALSWARMMPNQWSMHPLQADGQIMASPAAAGAAPNPEDALVKVHALGARKWRPDSKRGQRTAAQRCLPWCCTTPAS